MYHEPIIRAQLHAWDLQPKSGGMHLRFVCSSCISLGTDFKTTTQDLLPQLSRVFLQPNEPLHLSVINAQSYQIYLFKKIYQFLLFFNFKPGKV